MDNEIKFDKDFILETAKLYGLDDLDEECNQNEESENILKIIPYKIRQNYNCGIMTNNHHSNELFYVNYFNTTSVNMDIFNDKIIPFIYETANKNIMYIFCEDIVFCNLTKIKVSEETYESMNDRYVYDHRSHNITAVVFIEGDEYVDYVDKDYSDLSFIDFKMKLADDLLYVM